MWYSLTVTILVVAVSFGSPGCAGKTEIRNQRLDKVPLARQTMLLKEAVAEARAGHQEEAIRIAEQANALSGEYRFPWRRFRYDVPSSWCYITDGDPTFTMAGYSIVRRQAADLAAASMGLMVELDRTDYFDFAREFAGFMEALIVQKVAEEQARRGEAEKASAWADRLPDACLREHAKRGIADATESGK